MTNETNPGTVEIVKAAADAWEAFVKAREAMNAAVPDLMTGTPAERALYDERYRADHEAEREHFRTAITMAQHSRAILSALASQSQPAATVQEVGRELPMGFKAPFYVEVNADDTVDLMGADGHAVETYNTHTQLPLNRQDLLDEERDEWKAWAEFVANALNAAALTAEPAAKAGDADKLFAAINKEAKRANEVIRLNRHREGQGMITVATAMHRIEKWSERLSPPSPQPDMGSGEAERLLRNGRHLFKMARELGWPDDGGEGAYEFICRTHYEGGLAALSPPASQSVEKMTEALAVARKHQAKWIKRSLKHARKNGLRSDCQIRDIERAKICQDIADEIEALSTLPHKEEATPAPVGERIEVQIDDNPAGLPRAYDPEPEEWDGPLTAEEQAKIDAAWEKHKAADPVCRIPPEGWSCSRVAGHDGPSAATPATTERGRG